MKVFKLNHNGKSYDVELTDEHLAMARSTNTNLEDFARELLAQDLATPEQLADRSVAGRLAVSALTKRVVR